MMTSALSESFKDLCAVAAVPVQPKSKLSAALLTTSGKRSTAAELLNDKFVPVVRIIALASFNKVYLNTCNLRHNRP